MTTRLIIVAGLTAVFWVVPSIGTQGMGTIGQPFAHPDAILVDVSPTHRVAARATLVEADAVVEAALGL